MVAVPGPFLEGTLLRRNNRFSADIQTEQGEIACFVPNPGRMPELMVPGYRVVAAHRPGPKRRTAWDLVGVYYSGVYVSLDTRLPNAIAAEALAGHRIPEIDGYDTVQAEHRHKGSRFDFFLKPGDGRQPWLIEVKSCTLVEGGHGLFPDAPTTRGARHCAELEAALTEGYRCAVIFVIQRPDATDIAPYDDRDPAFGKALRSAVKAGVLALAWTCTTSPASFTLDRPVPVLL